MTAHRFAIAIMAAGKGTRLKSKRPKVLHTVAGKPLLQHVIDAALQVVTAKEIFVIVGHQAEMVQQALAHTGATFVLQAEQKGTGHAIQCLAPFVAGFDNLLVLSGDVPLITAETITRLRNFHLKQKAAMTILTSRPENPFGYGRVIRAIPVSADTDVPDPEVEAIIEQKALTPAQQNVPEINTGIYAFRTQPLFAQIGKLTTSNPHAEYYLTEMAAILRRAGERVVALEASNATEVLGANTIEEMMQLDAAMRMATARRWMAEGVSIFRPETCVIDADVTIGADTTLEPYVQLLGKTRVGENCCIRSHSVVQNSTLGDNVLVRNGCVLDEAEVGDGAFLGPYAHLRSESRIGKAAHIGNFVETKSATVGDGSKANHLTYLGNAEIGAGCNIGAGVITCNYDGVNKHPTKIGDGVFVGSDATLVAPVKLADGAYVAAGSCITDDVPADALALGRARQINKPDWARKRRAERKK
ncbi:MAG TPA: bifunctional UDP-N-acetylglucosamine diphosphorylase/glucosamine-1-phosphate N-acetyltransferase GlmU [Acidobacteriaceae bacterium]|jgi:bifunctional UDP-N-acetylglucosamine pyrophosphorylase/glucosamine-1-phosphate N-acetyltransferase|nr:bifunctional UDP-N-acetylglucosamine diphosphorylase/glucosamine-1-phosphate N-acetyltransferase GlmU [Acidobacteriaceae bacterium]